jgi:hypothetical protein
MSATGWVKWAVNVGIGHALLGAAAVGCGGSSSTPSCASGAHAENGACVPDVVCGPGTMPVGSTCFAEAPSSNGLECGPGTMESNGKCFPIANGTGGASGGDSEVGQGGLNLGGDASLGGAPSLTCGLGTMQEGSQCLPVQPEGAGGDSGGAEYVVQIGTDTLGADGYSSVPVFVVGIDASGVTSTENVVLALERPGAGSLSKDSFKLGPNGSTVYFTPCSSSSPFCVGSQRITLRLASAPNTVIAKSREFQLVAPTGIGSDSPCITGGNVVFFNGDVGEYVYAGQETITEATWSAKASTSQVHISVNPTDSKQGLWWDFYFDSSKLANPVLDTQVYENAERWPFQETGHPGFDVSGDGRGCNTVSGKFQIEELKTDGATLKSFTATFEHHCEGGSAALRGCVHYSQ